MSTKIEQITLNDVASYKEPTSIKDLKKLNFFFGSNGTGKSTIGKYLQALNKADDKQTIEGFEKCSITGYNPSEHEILVFNQQFIEDNFIMSNDMPGIFTLDKVNNKIQNKIDEEQNKINKWNECLGKLDIEKRKNEYLKKEIYSGANGVLDQVWKLRNDFKANFEKINLNYSQSKKSHYKHISSIMEKKEEQDIDYEDLKRDYKRLYEDLKRDYKRLYEEKISKIDQSFNSGLYSKIRRIEVKINNKLSTPFTGNKDVDIANMIETLGIRKWVEERWNQIDKTTLPQKCPFCQDETINQNLVKQFEDYFDKTYTEQKQVIENLKIEYNTLTKDFLDHLNLIEPNYPEKLYLTKFIRTLEIFFNKQKEVIQDKIDNTNKELSIASVNTHIQDLKTVLNTIASNNEDFEKLSEKRQELIQSIWNYMAFHAKEPIDEYKIEKEKFDKKLRQIKDITAHKENQIEKSESIIEEKRKETANTDTAKDKINETLKNTGFHGFSIEKKEITENNISRYYIKRPDEKKEDVFGTLSEGEKNFVAFLYFSWLCIGTDNQDKKKGKKKIIVIDDPVSSLDSKALFVVTTLIRELAYKKGNKKLNSVFANENIAQLIVLTHNLFFQKEVSFKADKFLCKDLHYYLISKNYVKSSISTPSTKELIKNDYELLWKSLAQIKNDETLKVIAGNLMRRILQTYLQFTQKEPKEAKILDGFNKKSNQYLIYRAFMSEINEQSHQIHIMNEFFYQSLNDSKTEDLMNVFKSIFNDIGKEHYKVMSNQYLTNNQ